MSEAANQDLEKELSELPEDVKAALDAHGFEKSWLLEQARLSRTGARSNVVSGQIRPCAPEDIVEPPEEGSAKYAEYAEVGKEALARGQCALVVLAGGMATRMGGVIKALVPAAHGKTFLDLRLAEKKFIAQTYGKTPPLWLMTSYATHAGIEETLGSALDDPHLALFKQGLSVRLDEYGHVFRTDSGQPSLHAPGHGDFAECLQKSGLLDQFVNQGGRYVMATNLDNLGGGLDPVLIGMHLCSGRDATCEVVDKDEGDRGGIPVRLDDKPVVLEEFRIPPDFDPKTVSVFSVNTFGFDAQKLRELDVEWTFFEVQKKVQERKAIQYERLINEVTFHLPTQYVRVPRRSTASRFLPVKDHAELERRRETLEALARARGMI